MWIFKAPAIFLPRVIFIKGQQGFSTSWIVKSIFFPLAFISCEHTSAVSQVLLQHDNTFYGHPFSTTSTFPNIYPLTACMVHVASPPGHPFQVHEHATPHSAAEACLSIYAFDKRFHEPKPHFNLSTFFCIRRQRAFYFVELYCTVYSTLWNNFFKKIRISVHERVI